MEVQTGDDGYYSVCVSLLGETDFDLTFPDFGIEEKLTGRKFSSFVDKFLKSASILNTSLSTFAFRTRHGGTNFVT